MWFFNSFAKSLYDLNWLRARRSELGKAFSYFFLLIFLYTGLTLAPAFVNFMRGDTVKEIKMALEQKVPDFTATVKNGELAITNLKQPYTWIDVEGQDRLMIVVDTVSTGTLRIEDYLQTHTKAMSGVLITKDRAEMFDIDKGQSRTQLFRDFPDFSFDRTQLIGWVNKFLSKPMLFAYFLFFFAMMYVVLGVWKLIFTLIISVIVMLIAKIAKKKWLFKEIYAVGLFAGTLAMVISAVLQGFDLVIPFIGTIAFLVWLGAAVLLDKPAPTPVEEAKLQ